MIRWRTRRRFWMVSLVGAMLASLATGCSNTSSPAPTTSAAIKPPPRDSVSALGRIEPGEGVVAINGTMGDRIRRVLVQPGQMVRSGEQLVEMQSEQVLAKQLDVARGKLEQARELAEKERLHADALLAEADLGIRRAAEVPQLQMEAQEAEVKVAENQLQQAERDLERMQQNFSQAEKDRQTQLVDRYREQLRALRAKLRLIEKEKELSALSAQQQKASAKAGTEKAQAMIDISGAERQVALVEAELERASLLSPIDGVVLDVDLQPGETVGQRPIMTLGRTDAYYVSAEVYEGDIARVKLGQKAEITSIALDKPLEGTVDRIGSVIKRNEVLGLDPMARSDTRVVEVRLRLTEPGPAPQRLGLQVDVKIATPAEQP